MLLGRRGEDTRCRVHTQGFCPAAEPSQVLGKPRSCCLPSETSRPSSLGPLWSLANLFFHCFEIALCFLTTPWCFVRFPCFASVKKAASQMLSLASSACLQTLGTQKATLDGPQKALPRSLCSAESAGCCNSVCSWVEQRLFFSRGSDTPSSIIKDPGEGAALRGRVF